MEISRTADLIQDIRSAMQPLAPDHPTGYDPVLELIGDAEVVLLGEATHGTRQFYEARAAISRRLIEEKGFSAIAVEGDWPDCYRVNRHLRGKGSDPDAGAALGDFQRFPTWMWRNPVVRELVDSLREHNRGHAHFEQAGFYGLDMYSLYRSAEAVLRYLAEIDPDAEAAARARYECLEQVGDGRYSGGLGPARADCESEVLRQLLDLRQAGEDYVRRGVLDGDTYFAALQNARVVANAEAYYRQMYRADVSSWNLRDQHMAESLAALKDHLSQGGEPARVIVWAHNSHVGDARATEFGRRGEHTLGQLVRQRYGERSRLIGLTTHHGSVTAATHWDGPAELQRVRPGLTESYEALLHGATADGPFLLPLRELYPPGLDEERLERAIGVIYQPRTERHSHYFHCRLPAQFDGVLHFDDTDALRPLDTTSEWVRGEAETYPFGV